MKKKVLIVTSIILCATSFFMGCAQKNNERTQHKSRNTINVNESGKSTFEIPKNYKKEINGITFNIDKIELPAGIDINALYECTASKQKPDQKKIIDEFSKGKKIVQKESMDTTAPDGSDVVYDYRSFSDGSEINATDGNMGWSTDFTNKISYSFNPSNMDKYDKCGEFNFESSDDSLNRVLEQLKKYGYKLNDYEYTYFLLDYETMRKQEKHEEKVGKQLDVHSEWTVNDNCYVMYINQKEQGLPIYFGNEYFMEDTDPKMMPVEGVISAKGIESIRVNNLYTFKKENRLIELINFDICVETVANKYGEILSDAKFVVERAKLYFVPKLNEKGKYDVKISWLFEIKKNGSDSDKEYILIDAESGKEITL